MGTSKFFISSRRLCVPVLVAVLLISSGCVTFYYKQFVTGGSPTMAQFGFTSNDLRFAVQIDTRPNEKRSLADSSFEVQTWASEEDECDPRTKVVLSEIELIRLDISWPGEIHHQKIDSVVRKDYCFAGWYSPNILIPQHIDTILVHLRFTLPGDSSWKDVDTTLSMYRSEGTERHFESF